MQKSRNRRLVSRVKRRLNASFEVGGNRRQAIAMEFSPQGFFLQSQNLLPIHTGVKVFLQLKPEQEIQVDGKVASARNQNPLASGVSKGGMGVKITNAPEEYFHFLQDSKA